MLKYIIDFVYIVIAIIIVIVFTKRGFIQSVFKFGKTLCAVILTFTVGPIVGDWIYDRFIYKGIYGWISEKMLAVVDSTVGSVDTDALIEGLPAIVKNFLVPDDIKAQFGENIENIGASVQQMSEAIASPVSEVISNIIAYILVYVAALLLLGLVGKIFDLIANIPIISSINSVLGFILGVISAFVFLGILTFAISLIISLFGNVLSLEELSGSSVFFGFFDKIQLFKFFS